MAIIRYNGDKSSASSSGNVVSGGVAGGLSMDDIGSGYLPATPSDDDRKNYVVDVSTGFNKKISTPSITLADASTGKSATLTLDSNGNLCANTAIISEGDMVAYGAQGQQVQTVQDLITSVISDMKDRGELSSGAGITSVALDYNSTLYKFRVHIIDGNNENFYSEYVDLPIESVVVSGEYDADNEKIVLKLQDSTTLDIPVGQLIAGLASETFVNNAISTEVTNRNSAISTAITSHGHTNINSKGKETMITGTAKPTSSGISMVEVYNNGYPVAYGNVINVKGNNAIGSGQLLCEWIGTETDATGSLYYRSIRDNTNSWGAWKKIAYTDSNVASANKLATARTLWGQSFDGSANVSGDMTNIAGGISMHHTNELNSFAGSGLYLQHRGNEEGCSGNVYMSTNGGNVGIGTSSPAYKLDVNGSIRSTGNLAVTGYATITGNIATNGNVKVASEGFLHSAYKSEAPIVKSHGNGNVTINAIGTSSSAGDLYLGYYNTKTIHFNVGSNYSANGNGTAEAEKMTLTSNGNFGIGTTSPVNKLHVNGNGRFNGYIDFLGIDSSTRIGYIGKASSNNNIYLNSDANNVLLQTTQGNVGIGITTPNAKLQVNSSDYNVINVKRTTADSGAFIKFIPNNQETRYCVVGADSTKDSSSVAYPSFCFYSGIRNNNADSNTEKMRLTYDGKLGIGTTSPSEKLAVNGSINIGSVASNSRNWLKIGGITRISNYVSDLNSTVIRGAKIAFDNVNGSKTLASIDGSGNLVASGDVTAYSDARLKSNIKDLEYRGALNPKTYIKDGKECIGFIAQEVKELYPELVHGEETDTQYLSLNYGAITAVLASENKQLRNEIDELKLMVKKLMEDKK